MESLSLTHARAQLTEYQNKLTRFVAPFLSFFYPHQSWLVGIYLFSTVKVSQQKKIVNKTASFLYNITQINKRVELFPSDQNKTHLPTLNRDSFLKPFASTRPAQWKKKASHFNITACCEKNTVGDPDTRHSPPLLLATNCSRSPFRHKLQEAMASSLGDKLRLILQKK